MFHNSTRTDSLHAATGFKRSRSQGNVITADGSSLLTSFPKKSKGEHYLPQGGRGPPGSVFSPANSGESQGRNSSSSQNTHSMEAVTAANVPDRAFHVTSPRYSREESSTTHVKTGAPDVVGQLTRELGEGKVAPLLTILRNAVLAEHEHQHKKQHAGGSPRKAADAIPSVLAAALKIAQGEDGSAAAASGNAALPKLQDGGMTRSQALMESPSMSTLLLMTDRKRGVTESTYRPRAPVLASSSSVQSLSGRYSQDLSGDTAPLKSTAVKSVATNSASAEIDKPASVASMASPLNKVLGSGHTLAASYNRAMLSKHAQQPPTTMAPPMSRALSADRSGISSFCQYGGSSSKLSPTSPLVHASSAGGSLAASYAKIMASKNAPPLDHSSRTLAENYSRLMEAKNAQGAERLGQTLRSALSDQSCLQSLGTKLSASNLTSMLAKVSSSSNAGFAQALALLNESRGASPSKLERIASQLSEGHALSPKHLEMIEESRRQTEELRQHALSELSGDKYVPASVLQQARSFASSDARSQNAPVEINPQTIASLLFRHAEQPQEPPPQTAPPPLLAGYNALQDRTIAVCQTAAGRAYFTQIATSVAAFADKVEGVTVWSDSLRHGGNLRFRNAICKMAWFLMRKRARMEMAASQPPPPLPPLHPAAPVIKGDPDVSNKGHEVSSAVLMLAELCRLQQQMTANSQWHPPPEERAPLNKPARGTPLPGRGLPMGAQKV